MTDYQKSEFNSTVFDITEKQTNQAQGKYAQLEYRILENRHRPNTLKRFEVTKYEQALNCAKEKIKRHIITHDESPDNSVVYTAITNFGKTNE